MRTPGPRSGTPRSPEAPIASPGAPTIPGSASSSVPRNTVWLSARRKLIRQLVFDVIEQRAHRSCRDHCCTQPQRLRS
jgi:hypothetical protein